LCRTETAGDTVVQAVVHVVIPPLSQLKDGHRLISGSHDGSVKLWDSTVGGCLFTSDNAHTDWVTCSAKAGDMDTKFVTGSNDNLVILWKLDNKKIFVISKFSFVSIPLLSTFSVEFCLILYF